MKTLLIFLFFALIVYQCNAQKLPDVQLNNMAVPAGIKIDGKDTEWNNSFAAENKRISIFYSLTNDQKNLYLVIKAIDKNSLNKIMLGGITFVVNTEGKKRAKDAYEITFPVVKTTARMPARVGQNRMNGSGSDNRSPNAQQADSINFSQKRIQLASAKEIKILNFRQLPDTLISIYNEYGIKAVATIDKNGLYFYELALPINLLGLTIEKTDEFAYQIKINGVDLSAGNNFQGNGFGAGRNTGGGSGNFPRSNAASTAINVEPVDFWGKYKFK